MSAQDRSYVVGLPVVVTVTEDGTVLVAVDLSDFAQAVWESGPQITPLGHEIVVPDDTVRADIERVEEAVTKGGCFTRAE